jgi:hypothetical protein
VVIKFFFLVYLLYEVLNVEQTERKFNVDNFLDFIKHNINSVFLTL